MGASAFWKTQARLSRLCAQSLCGHLGLDPLTTLGPKTRFDLTRGCGERNPDARWVLVVELVALQRVQHNRRLAPIFEVHEAKEELAPLTRFLGNQARIDEARKRAEDVTDFAFSGIVWDSF